jgi:tRNA A-37 threonylcarbamoyl transferase component Bud32
MEIDQKSVRESQEYFPYGPFDITIPPNDSADPIGLSLVERLRMFNSSRDKLRPFFEIIENSLARTLEEIYRMYHGGITSFIIDDVIVSNYGVGKHAFIKKHSSPMNQVLNIYDTINIFVNSLKEMMFHNLDLLHYLGQHVVKFSRSLWNRDSSKINTESVMKKVISNATNYYISCSDATNHLPDKFSVATITPRGMFETRSLQDYAISYEQPILSEMRNINIRKDGVIVPLATERINLKDENVLSYIAHRMIRYFMKELHERIIRMIQPFPTFFDKFFESSEWSEDKRVHNIVYFDVAVEANDPEVFRISKYIGAGAYGTVHQICEKVMVADMPIGENCGYVMKIQRFYDQFLTAETSRNEARITQLASTLGLAPVVKSFIASKTYAITITEKMDMSLVDILNIIQGNAGWRDAIEYALGIAIDNLSILHEHGIVHCDPHLGNIMFVSSPEEKFDWKNLNSFSFINGLHNGKIVMKFIDFGLASTREDIIRDPRKKWEFYTKSGTIGRLQEVGCLGETSSPSDLNRLFEILEFYDISFIFVLGMHPAGNSHLARDPFLMKIMDKEKELQKSSGCNVGGTFR